MMSGALSTSYLSSSDTTPLAESLGWWDDEITVAKATKAADDKNRAQPPPEFDPVSVSSGQRGERWLVWHGWDAVQRVWPRN